MSRITRHIAASPGAVFDVLADGWSYTNWVVGTSHMRAVDSSWPAKGAAIHHAAGAWPLVVRDETVVESVEPRHQLTLTVRTRPFGEARVVIELVGDDHGTMVSLEETVVRGPGARLPHRLTDLVLDRRNVESLARLGALAERRTSPAR